MATGGTDVLNGATPLPQRNGPQKPPVANANALAPAGATPNAVVDKKPRLEGNQQQQGGNNNQGGRGGFRRGGRGGPGGMNRFSGGGRGGGMGNNNGPRNNQNQGMGQNNVKPEVNF